MLRPSWHLALSVCKPSQIAPSIQGCYPHCLFQASSRVMASYLNGFIEGLPRSGSANCILVVVNRFSKFAHFVPLLHPFTAPQVAQLFLDNIYRLHGMPTHIVSDRDRIFTNMFWKELFRLAQTTLCMSSAYHPQLDGQTKRVNQCLETYLRCFVQACPRQWVKWLSLAEYWYNTSLHSSLNRSPFEVLYGHPPRHFGLTPPEASSVPDVDTMWILR